MQKSQKSQLSRQGPNTNHLLSKSSQPTLQILKHLEQNIPSQQQHYHGTNLPPNNLMLLIQHLMLQGLLWIIFEHSMIIELRQELLVSSNKTIEGRGVNYMNNVIIHGIHIKKIVPKDGDMIKDSYTHFGLRIRSDDDAISILEPPIFG
ncbi:putative pectate lyase 3, partial [Mucuna pruriens]